MEQPDGVVRIVGPHRIGTDELRQPVLFVGGRAPLRLLLVENDVDPGIREQERRLRPRQTAADDVDVALHPRALLYGNVSAGKLGNAPQSGRVTPTTRRPSPPSPRGSNPHREHRRGCGTHLKLRRGAPAATD